MTTIINVSDIQGTSRLAIDAVTGLTDIVEDLHHTISIAGIFGAPDQHRTTGITGMVYQSIRTVSKIIGTGINCVLYHFRSLFTERKSESSSGRKTVVAILNGVLGDYLVESRNPFAISMKIHWNREPVSMDDQAFSKAIQESGGKVVLMVHGSCMNDLQWNRQGHDHGAFLARDLGYVPIYLHYNSGLHISENGRSFSDLMETFINQLAQPIELVIIAHSMGGLVSRSACHYGKVAGYTWLNYLQKMVFIGTPHHGAPLEKLGNLIHLFLEINPYIAPLSRLGKIRSAGVTDMRYGYLVDEDWKGHDRFEHVEDNRIAVPLPDHVQCYAIAGTIIKEPNKIGDYVIGDGLVTLTSALGRHKNAEMNLLFPESNQWIGRNVTHLGLLNQPEVYENIKQWLAHQE
ncbi:MAG: hypothetical protein HQK77_12705 [Desulfobacterales bacterium]|nr:hypothetical protein [Desulfobacterales bacterium]